MHRLSAPNAVRSRALQPLFCRHNSTLPSSQQQPVAGNAKSAPRLVSDFGGISIDSGADTRQKQNAPSTLAARLAEARAKAPPVDAKAWREKWQGGAVPPPAPGTTPAPAQEAAPKRTKAAWPTARSAPAAQPMHWEKAPPRSPRGPQAYAQRDGQQRGQQRGGQRQGRRDGRDDSRQQQRRRRRDEDEDEGDASVPKLGGQAAVATVESSTVADVQYLLSLSPEVAASIKKVPELAPAVQQAASARAAATRPEPDTFRFVMDGAAYDLPLDATTQETVTAFQTQFPKAVRVIHARAPRILALNLDDVPEAKQAACQASLLELAERAPAEAYAAAEEAARFALAQSVRLRDEHSLTPPKFVQKLREGYVNEEALEEYVEGGAWPQERDENKRNAPDVDFADLSRLLDAAEGLGAQAEKVGKVRDLAVPEAGAPPAAHTLEARGYGRYSPVAQPPNVAAIALAGARRTVPPKQRKGVVETARATLAKRPEVTLPQRNTAEGIIRDRLSKA
ncbi:hypothetical protein HDZ31DRAFT_76357 [Schizophyllum fasciatum]